MNKIKTRNAFMDNLKGILIFCVVLGHFCEKYIQNHENLKYLIFFIYLFHMPCFIFVSGYFSKEYNFIKNSKLIYQYTIMGIIYTFIVNKFPGYLLTFGFASTPWTLWYLLALFYWRTIINFITTKKYAVVIVLSFIFAIIAGCFKYIGIYFTLARAIGFFPFFLLGYYSNETIIKKIKKINKYLILLFAVIIILSTYIIVSTNFIPLQFQWSSKSFEELKINNWDGIFYKIIILFLEILSCIVIINLTPINKTILTKAGENTIVVYLFHATIIFLITYFVKDVEYKGLIYLLILFLTSITVFALSSKPAKKLFDLLMKPYEKISRIGDAK